MPDMFGYLSGYDLRMRVAQRMGLSSGIITDSGNRLTANEDDVLKGNAIEDCINNELRSWWMKIADMNGDRIAAFHDFTYPSAVECLGLRPGMGGQVRQMSPPLPAAPMRLRTVEWRVSDGVLQTIPFVQWEQFTDYSGLRWSNHADRLYVADAAGRLAPGAEFPLRLHYLPLPLPINTQSDVVRYDIPNEIQNALVVGATLRCLAVARVRPQDPQYVRLEAEYREESALAVRSVTRTTTRSHTLEWNSGPMTEVW